MRYQTHDDQYMASFLVGNRYIQHYDLMKVCFQSDAASFSFAFAVNTIFIEC